MFVSNKSNVTTPPLPPMELFEIIHNVSLFLLEDDKTDIGRFVYYNRDDHYYHGRKSPHHPSPFHHWQIGMLGLLFSQIGALATKAMEVMNTFEAVETGDYSNIDPDLLDDSVIPLEDYKQEIADEIQSQPSTLNMQAFYKPSYQIPQNHKKLEVPKPKGLLGYRGSSF